MKTLFNKALYLIMGCTLFVIFLMIIALSFVANMIEERMFK